MAFIEINPKYQELLHRYGLKDTERILDLPAVIVSGHPDRNVAQVTLGRPPEAITAFLKREHRIPWRDRPASAWAGSGFVSKSCREARTLRVLAQRGIGCPEWVAAGEDDHGRAFLLVREITGALDLRVLLRQRSATPRDRYNLTRKLGAVLAGLHASGFSHPDLYSKHVLVDPATEAVYFLDWQRSRRGNMTWRRRWRDLATLHATLAPDLATPRQRLACLLAYFRAANAPRQLLGAAAKSIERRAHRLLTRRHIREMRQPPLATGTQNLIRLDGEALCVTREFWATLGVEVPEWLHHALPRADYSAVVESSRVALPGGGTALLVGRRERNLLGWLHGLLRRRPMISRALRQAGILFRLQRYGIRTPRLLALGQRQTSLGRVDSFLLTEPIADAMPLAAWLSWRAPSGEDCRRLLRECEELLERLHEARCYVGGPDAPCPFFVLPSADGAPAVVLGSVDGICTRRRASRSLARRDHGLLRREFEGITYENSLLLRERPAVAWRL
jgi:tRNA A-37 threonylcarbamoyl transferase component Bud32